MELTEIMTWIGQFGVTPVVMFLLTKFCLSQIEKQQSQAAAREEQLRKDAKEQQNWFQKWVEGRDAVLEKMQKSLEKMSGAILDIEVKVDNWQRK